MKATKEATNYRDGTKQRHCSICVHWRSPRGGQAATCSKVQGEIHAGKDCDLYKAAK